MSVLIPLSRIARVSAIIPRGYGPVIHPRVGTAASPPRDGAPAGSAAEADADGFKREGHHENFVTNHQRGKIAHLDDRNGKHAWVEPKNCDQKAFGIGALT
ncbi:hypothetical protein [Streptomyces sp. NPDC048489]|uniref:hypothetical protein n=1 Tax=Streptomyces sp. NPDC048489 TaxID=3154504 RepID=UPI00343A3230